MFREMGEKFTGEVGFQRGAAPVLVMASVSAISRGNGGVGGVR
jgi:hypothetical protein